MTAGWAVEVPEAESPWKACVLCGAASDDQRDVRPSMWPLRDRPKSEAWASGQRCVDHMSCRIRRERSGRTWPVDDGSPPTRVPGQPPDEPPVPAAASGEVEPMGTDPVAPSPVTDAGPEPDWTFE